MLLWLVDLAARPISAAIVKVAAGLEFAVAVVVSARVAIFGAEVPDGVLVLVLATGFGLLGWFGTLALRLDRATTALEIRLSNLADDGLASSKEVRDLAERVNGIETEVAIMKARQGYGDRRSSG